MNVLTFETRKPLQEPLGIEEKKKKLFANTEIQQTQYKIHVNRDRSLHRINHMPDFFETDKFASSQLCLFSLVALGCSCQHYGTNSFNKV